MEASFIVYIILAFLALLYLALVLPLHFAPYAITGIPTAKRINTVLLMLVVNAAMRCVIAALDVTASKGASRSACSIDSIWTLYTTTVLCATLVPLVLYHQAGCFGRRWSPFECVARTAPVYVYGVVPVIWVLIRSNQLGKLNSGLGTWWGTYCVPDLSRWRTVRLVTLLVPLSLTALLTLNAARLSKDGRSCYLMTAPSKSALANLLALSIVGIIYLALEATIGWKPSWWPRAFEPLFCLIVLFQGEFLPYLRTVTCGLRLRQPPNYRWRIKSPLSEAKEDEDQPWASAGRRHRQCRHLTPIPEETEGSTYSPDKPNVPVIAVQYPTPGHELSVSVDPLNRTRACAPSLTPHRYSNPFSDAKMAQPLSPVPSEPEECLPTPIPFRGFLPRPQHYSYDSETGSDASVNVQPPSRLSQLTSFTDSSSSLNGDNDDPPLSPLSVVSSATFGRRTTAHLLSSVPPAPSTLRSDTFLPSPRAPFASDPHRLSVMTMSSIAGSFVTASAGPSTYTSPNPSGYVTATEGSSKTPSPSSSVVADDGSSSSVPPADRS